MLGRMFWICKINLRVGNVSFCDSILSLRPCVMIYRCCEINLIMLLLLSRDESEKGPSASLLLYT